MKNLQESTFKNKPAETVQVIQSHPDHLLNLGVLDAGPGKSRIGCDIAQEFFILLIRSEILTPQVLLHGLFRSFSQSQTERWRGNEVKIPDATSLVKREHTAGPGTILIDRTSLGRNKRTDSVSILLHLQQDDRKSGSFGDERDGVFFQEIFR